MIAFHTRTACRYISKNVVVFVPIVLATPMQKINAWKLPVQDARLRFGSTSFLLELSLTR